MVHTKRKLHNINLKEKESGGKNVVCYYLSKKLGHMDVYAYFPKLKLEE